MNKNIRNTMLRMFSKGIKIGGASLILGIRFLKLGYICFYVLKKTRNILKNVNKDKSIIESSFSLISEEKMEILVKKIKNFHLLFLASFYDKTFIQMKNKYYNETEKNREDRINHIESPKKDFSESFKEILNCKDILNTAEMVKSRMFKTESSLINSYGFNLEEYRYSLKKYENTNEYFDNY